MLPQATKNDWNSPRAGDKQFTWSTKPTSFQPLSRSGTEVIDVVTQAWERKLRRRRSAVRIGQSAGTNESFAESYSKNRKMKIKWQVLKSDRSGIPQYLYCDEVENLSAFSGSEDLRYSSFFSALCLYQFHSVLALGFQVVISFCHWCVCRLRSKQTRKDISK